jgi:hypothetical protein
MGLKKWSIDFIPASPNIRAIRSWNSGNGRRVAGC